MSRFQFVADHQHAFEVKRLCEVVQVARSLFYAWQTPHPCVLRARRPTPSRPTASVRSTIKTALLGAPRITAELNDGAPAGDRVSHKRVACVMRGHAIAGLRLRRRVRTTIPEPAEQKVLDRLGRDFSATTPNQRNVGDITYLPIADGSNRYLWCSVESEHTVPQLVAPVLSCSDSIRTRILWTATQEHSTEWTR